MTAGGDDDATADGTGDAQRVSMTEFAFDPDPIVLEAGDARLEVVNDGAVAHDLVINELGKGTPDLPAGERMVVDLSDQPAGTYRVVCDLPGHTEAGMVTELTLR
jgi:plastocyanin